MPDNATLAASALPPKPGLTTLSVALAALQPEALPPSKAPLGSRFVAADATTAGTSAAPASTTDKTTAPAAPRMSLDM